MRLTIAELMRTLEYVPRDTAPDLHEKILGHIVTAKFREALKNLKGKGWDDKYAEIYDSLNEAELSAWKKTGAKLR